MDARLLKDLYVVWRQHRIDQEVRKMAHDDLRTRETARRKALWTLAHLLPGNPTAAGVLTVLAGVDLQERKDTSLADSELSVEELRSSVPTVPHSIGLRIVREQSIPQPWRERFIRASVGSTRVAEGLYAHDWQSFLDQWVAEMQHLEAHRIAHRNC